MSLISLVSLLRNPALAQAMSDAEWNEPVMQARQVELAGQLYFGLERHACIPHTPPAVLRALDLTRIKTNRRIDSVRWELSQIRKAVSSDIPILLLKGCAYALAEDTNANGRLFSDIDILVPHHDLPRVESDLAVHGWQASDTEPYDQKYYREWMHEIPPMEHLRRGTVLDIHHAIIPVVSRYAFDATRLFDDAIEHSPGIFVLSPFDRIIHCAVHAFIEGVPSKALRDLYDLNCLVRQHAATEELCKPLLARAKTLRLDKLLTDALSASAALFSLPPAYEALTRTRSLRASMLRKAALTANRPRANAYHGLLLAHSHWMKMPMSLLIPHLVRKAWLEHRPSEE